MPILVRVELGEPESADAVAPVVQLVASGTASRYRCVPLRVRPPFRNAYERWCDVEIAVGLDRSLGLSWDQYRELGRLAARLGYQSVWTNASIDRDAMQICAQWSVASADVAPGGIGTGLSVVPVGYWSVPALASSAATVGEISGGKFVLGVGSGSLHLPAFRRSLGLDKNLRPLATMREWLVTLRALLAGETVTHEGQAITLRGITLGSKPPKVPVALGALGPNMLRLAGEASDGASLNWCTPEQVASSREIVVRGAHAAGRPEPGGHDRVHPNLRGRRRGRGPPRLHQGSDGIRASVARHE